MITVLVTAHDASETIGACLASIATGAESPGEVEILVVDDRSADDTSGAARRAGVPGLRILRVDALGDATQTARQRALDLGIRAAKGEWVLLTDADAVVPARWMERLSAEAVRRGAAAAFGPVHHASRSGARNAWHRLLTIGDAARALLSPVLGPLRPGLANAVVSKAAYESLGGFPALGRSLVEGEQLARALLAGGRRVAFPAGPPVRVHAPRDLAGAIAREVRLLRGAGSFLCAASLPLALLLSALLGGDAWAIAWIRILAGLCLLGASLVRIGVARDLPWIPLFELAAPALAVATVAARWARPVTWAAVVYGGPLEMAPSGLRPKRTVRPELDGLDPEEPVPVEDFHHATRFHRALVNPGSALAVSYQIEWFGGPVEAHGQLRFHLAPGGAVVLGPEGAREDVGDIVFSVEAITPFRRSFDTLRGLLGLYPVAYRLTSLAEKLRTTVTEEGRSITEVPLRLTAAESSAALRIALELAQKAAREDVRFASFGRNCSTEAFRILDGATRRRGPVAFLRHFPHLAPRYLAVRGLVDRPS